MISASAPGKINLYFAVGPKLANGYHEVCSVYLALNLRDTVTVQKSNEFVINVTGTVKGLEGVPTDQSNLVAKAAALFTNEPLHITIDKHVPVAGGMGGGSADAAAAALAVQTLTKQSAKDLTPLGADVPFAAMGGLALGLGIGEKLTPITTPLELHVVLITNPNGLSTPAVYNKLDELRESADLVPSDNPLAPTELIEALEAGDLETVVRNIHNDLQWAALELKPELQETIDRALVAGALTAQVSGSGPTVFAIAKDAESAKKIADTFGSSAIATSGPSVGAEMNKQGKRND
jgi:4-diphosphocytidyl-2-C-methyl-D-erythritol kinase